MSGPIKKIISTLALVGLWLLIWQAAFMLSGKEDYQFAPPIPVLRALWDGISDGTFARGVLASLARIGAGFGLALLIGTTLGLLLVISRFVEWLLGPLVLGVQSLPSICWLPVSIMIFGLAEKTILFVVLMGSVGSIAIATRDGLQQVPITYQRVAGTFGASVLQRLLWVSAPAALPAFISGLKQGWSFAWRSLLAGELIFHTAGVGGLLSIAQSTNDYPMMFAVMIVVVLVSVLVDKIIFTRLEDRIRLRWGLAARGK